MRPSLPVLSLTVAALLLAAALLPALDHHLAERVPGHMHLGVLSAAPLLWSVRVQTHVHPYEQAHRHVGGQPVEAPADPRQGKIVSVIDPHGSIASVWSTWAASWLAPLPKLPPPEILSPTRQSSTLEPLALAIAPPEPPPIAAS